MNQRWFSWNEFFSKKICSFSVSKDAQLVRFMCYISGLGEAQQVFLKSDLKNLIQKLRVGTNSPCLLRLQTRKLPEQKNNRPHQVKLENGRSWSQNDFQIWKAPWEASLLTQTCQCRFRLCPLPIQLALWHECTATFLSADNSTCVNRTLQWRWRRTVCAYERSAQAMLRSLNTSSL